VTRIVVSHAADVIGATVASLARRTDDDMLSLVGIRGTTDELATKYASVPVDGSTPIGEAVRTRQLLIVSGRDEIRERFPDLDLAAEGERTLIALPLNVGARTLGGIGLSFPGRRTFDSAEQEFLGLLADICAQSMDRIQALADADDRARKLAFLAQAEVELASSLDYHTTLRKVAWIGVPDFADWCTISLLEDGELRTLEVAHVDRGKVQLVRELQQRYPADRTPPTAPGTSSAPAGAS
jgi:transcriptional regulator with GAF, ATPase, and Fis domain